MKHIAMVIQRYLPHVGGAERQLQQLAPRLRDLGIETSIITRGEEGLLPFELIDDVPVYRMPAFGPKPIAAGLFTASAVSQLTRLQPDLVHAHEILTPASVAMQSKRINKHPIVVKLLRGGARGDIFKLKRRPLWKRYFAHLNHSVDAFITISQEIEQELETLHVPVSQRVFIPNGVDVARHVPVSEDERQKLRVQLSLPPHAHLVVYAGRLVPEKRVDHLLKIWDAVRRNFFDAHLVVLGNGSEESRLRDMHVPSVQFTGQVDEAGRYLQAADLFVLPSSTEGLSNSMLEAMSCGLPVLATTVGGAPDVIQHNVSGYLIPPDNIEALQHGVETLLGDGAMRFRLGAEARSRIVGNFSLDSVTERLAALYDRLLTQQPIRG